MTERDTGATTDGDGRRSTDAPAEPNDPMVPPPSVPSAFGSTPAGWQPTAAPAAPVPTAGSAPITGASPTVGSAALPTVPSRRSLRGKPPVSTAAIPVVPAAQRPATAPGPTSGESTPPAPTTPPAPPAQPSAATAAAAPAPARRPAWSRPADAEPAAGPTWAPTSAPAGSASTDASGWASAAATIPTDPAVTQSAGEPFAPDLAFGSTGASPLPNRSSTRPATDTVEEAAPFTPDLALGSAPLPSRAPAAGDRPGGTNPVTGPTFDPPSGTAPTSDRPGTPQDAAPVPAFPEPPAADTPDTAPKTGQLAQAGQPAAGTPDTAPRTGQLAQVAQPAPTPIWHPVTGQIPVVDPATPWQPVTGQQPLVAAPEQPATAQVADPAVATADPATATADPATEAAPAAPTAHGEATTQFPAAPAPGATGPAIDASTVTTEHSEEPVTPPRRNRRALWITLIVVGVLALGAAGAGAWYLINRDEPTPEQQVVQAPSPTSALTAVDRTATSAFAATLPATVLQYALTGSQDDPEWVAAGAIESYLDTYADEAGDQLTVHSGQWATAVEAQAQQTALAAAVTGEVISSGAVTVSGADAGTVTVVDLGDGTGTAVWSNSTAVFVLTAPLADVSNAFAAYPI